MQAIALGVSIPGRVLSALRPSLFGSALKYRFSMFRLLLGGFHPANSMQRLLEAKNIIALSLGIHFSDCTNYLRLNLNVNYWLNRLVSGRCFFNSAFFPPGNAIYAG